MTTEQGRTPAPSIAITANSRPAWVTGELVAQWDEWARRDVTRHSREAQRMDERIRAGSVNVNDGAAAGSIEAGMGGSGLGRHHGAERIREYTESRTLDGQRLMPLGPPPKSSAAGFGDRTRRQPALMRELRVR
jgi:hypothetical protein